jgi:serine/threonine protein phosphatase PrpC
MISVQATHQGLVRQNNEDCIRSDDNLGLYLLADGMGGHNAGEIASALAVDSVYKLLSSGTPNSTAEDIFDLMEKAMHEAHLEISARARTSFSLMGMGTTLVIAVVRDKTAYIAHAGDSRAYLFSPSHQEGKNLEQITRDHTMGDLLLESGIPRGLIPEKQFHTLTRAVGYDEAPAPDFNTVELDGESMLLLCSDGLTDMLTDSEIGNVLLNGHEKLETLADILIDTANAKGGRDNVSVLLVKIDDGRPFRELKTVSLDVASPPACVQVETKCS